MDTLIVLAANMIAGGVETRDVRAMLLAEVDDEALAFLLFTAGELLASSS